MIRHERRAWHTNTWDLWKDADPGIAEVDDARERG